MAQAGHTGTRGLRGRAIVWVGIALWGPATAASASRADLPGGNSLDALFAVALPTLGEWGMLLATLSLLAAGTSVILGRRRR